MNNSSITNIRKMKSRSYVHKMKRKPKTGKQANTQKTISESIAGKFISSFKKGQRLNVGTVMIGLKISRPTATNLINEMLRRKIIIPTFEIGDSHKWYKVS